MKNNKKTVLALSALLAATSINTIAYADSDSVPTTEVVVDSEDIVFEEDIINVNSADKNNPASISNVSYPTGEGDVTEDVIEEMKNIDTENISSSKTYETLDALFADNPDLIADEEEIVDESNTVEDAANEEQPVLDDTVEEELDLKEETEEIPTLEEEVENTVEEEPIIEDVAEEEPILEVPIEGDGDNENLDFVEEEFEITGEPLNLTTDEEDANDKTDLTFEDIDGLEEGEYSEYVNYEEKEEPETIEDVINDEDSKEVENENSSLAAHQKQMRKDSIKISTDSSNDLRYEDIKEQFEKQKQDEIPASYETWVKDSYVDKTNVEEDDIDKLTKDKELSKFEKHQKQMQKDGIKITKDDKRDLKWEDIVDKSIGEHEQWVDDPYVDKTKKDAKTINEILDDEDNSKEYVDNDSQQKVKVPNVKNDTSKQAVKVPYVQHDKKAVNNPQTGVSSAAVTGILVASILGTEVTKKKKYS